MLVRRRDSGARVLWRPLASKCPPSVSRVVHRPERPIIAALVDGQHVRLRAAPVPARRQGFWRSLPWRAWAPWLAMMAAATFACFGLGESTRVSNPAAWFSAGFGIAGVITTVCAFRTLRAGRWARVGAFALAVSAVISLALFTMSAPSASRSCANNSQPAGAGVYDCDTSGGLAGPIVLVGFWVPAFALAAAGSGAGRAVTRPRGE